jgi:erythromycin esterase
MQSDAEKTSVPSRLTSWGRSNAIDLADRAAMLDLFVGAKVIALGEPGHGAHEPLQFRNDLARLLVTQGNVGAIALETGAVEARDLEQYVFGAGNDDPVRALRALTWGFSRLEANRELIEWLRLYNRTASTPVRLHGFDLPGGDRGELVGAAVAARRAAEYFEVQGETGLTAELHWLEGELTPARVRALSASDRRRARTALDSADEKLNDARESEARFEGWDERAWAQTAVRMARAAFEMLCIWPQLPADISQIPDDIIEPILEASSIRDRAMAQTVLDILQRLPPGRRVLMFAANGHVIADRHRGGLWTGRGALGEPAGLHLRAALGPAYRVLLTASATSINGAPAGSLDQWLAAVKQGDRGMAANFALDLRQAPRDAWLEEIQSIGTNNVYIQAFHPRSACDSIAYFATLTPAAHIAE